MNNPDQYNETIAAARRLGIPVNSPSQNDDAVRSFIEKFRSDTKINEEKELVKIQNTTMTLRHSLWGKTMANASVCLLGLGMFTIGGMLLYRDKQGDTDKAIKLILASSSVLLVNSSARSFRSLLTGEKDSP